MSSSAGAGPPLDSPPDYRHGLAEDQQEETEVEHTEDADEDEDDDMDFEPTSEDGGEVEFYETIEDSSEDEFEDAPDMDSNGIEVEIQVQSAEPSTTQDEDGGTSTRPGPQTRSATRTRTTVIPASRIMQLLGPSGLRQILRQNQIFSTAGDDDNDEDPDFVLGGSSRQANRERPAKDINNTQGVPSEEGRKLMDASVFGVSEYYRDARRKRSKKLAHKIMTRELGLDRSPESKTARAISQDMIPSTTADTIIHYNERCYSGQFSDDGNFFFSCAQDFKVRMYDTSNPYHWKYYKTVDYPFGQWTITDASLSPDNKYLAYSSIRSIVCLAPTDPADKGEPWVLDFSNSAQSRTGRGHYHHSHFGIWSLRFSGDGREIVAGTSDHAVYVYDVESRQTILRIPGHNDHVNAVCFGDSSSPHILYSGSDDTLIKVWDRRSMGDSREAGVFMGHTEGLTYVDSKGDGRYVLSNGKDQTMKLWDLRKMMSTEKASTIDAARYSTNFDYRFTSFSAHRFKPHPHDCSLVTYRGHSVLKTLIRCHFSPPSSTNSRYVYSGSEDGGVYIYNLDATLAGKINVNDATKNSRPRDSGRDAHVYTLDGNQGQWKTCVRDASWHPSAPVIAATSWNGWGMGSGTCTTHSWNDGLPEDEGDNPPMSTRVNHKLQRDGRLEGAKRNRGVGPRHVTASYNPATGGLDDVDDDDDDDDDNGGSWWQ